MTSDSFDLFTQEGEKRADRLIRAICADIAEDRLTRRQALDRAADAIEQVAAIDEGVADPEPIAKIAERLSGAFEVAGFLAVAGGELRSHYDAWRQAGAAVQHAALPDAVALVSSAARSFAAAASPLFGRADIKAQIADARPWEDGFQKEPIASAELVLCIWNGEATGNPNVCCVIAGPSGYVYIEQLPDAETVAASALRAVLRRDDIDYGALSADLRRLAAAVHLVNMASHLVNAPGHLSFALNAGQSGPAVVAMWDGEPLAAARQDDAAAAALADSAVSEAFLPEVLRQPADMSESGLPDAPDGEDAQAEAEAGPAAAPFPAHQAG